MRLPLPVLSLIFVAACAWHGVAPAAETRTLAPGVSWLAGEFIPGRQPDGNSIVFQAPEGQVVFDTGRSTGHAQKLLAALRRGQRPLSLIVNSHWHLDHIGGNAALKQAYPAAKVMASGAIGEARTGFLARYRHQVQERLASLPADSPERGLMQHELEIIDARDASAPDLVVSRTERRRLAGREFVVGLATQAATAGDVWLLDPASKVLAAGDLVTLPAPFFDTACTHSWAKALDQLAAQEFDWLVPGHGAPMQRAGFERYRGAYRSLLRCAASDAGKQQCIDGWLEEAGPLIPEAAQKMARRLLDHYLDQHLRQPEAQQRLGCPAG